MFKSLKTQTAYNLMRHVIGRSFLLLLTKVSAKIHSRDTHTKMCFTQISQSIVWRRMAVVKQQKQFWYLKEKISLESFDLRVAILLLRNA